ncbi:MAG TPA: hypothetical protein VL727_15745 [Puia sp.]|nr:hypothetical protein [Puia sp.]
MSPTSYSPSFVLPAKTNSSHPASTMEQNQFIRKIVPVMLTLVVLGIFLSLYLLKYIPARQNDYNSRASLELEQIVKAVKGKNTGYTGAVRSYAASKFYSYTQKTTSPLLHSFVYTPSSKPDTLLTSLPPLLSPDKKSIGNWRITYPLSDASSFSLRIDSFLRPIVLTYQDIFQHYLLIQMDDSLKSKGLILFNSDNLPLGKSLGLDSLLKKQDGLSLPYVHDVSIEGVSQKMFLYPFQLNGQQLLLTGLINTSDYTSGYKDFPLRLFVPALIIILLLVISLPILKIFILGSGERINDGNIRLIIGSYFAIAFTCFFLFSWLFLDRTQAVSTQNNLSVLSDSIQTKFIGEIGLIHRQLKQWDQTFQVAGKDPVLFKAIRGQDSLSKDSIRVDDQFYPKIYPYVDYGFWIGSSGKWLGTWSGKKGPPPPLIDVSDRGYFKDLMEGRYLSLVDGTDTSDFTILPTFSRLDGEYTITVTIRSDHPANKDQPVAIGLSSQMYSVTRTILPTGYNFSIIDETGSVLYDSKPGRALVSNILNESEDPSTIEECLHFRDHRYFHRFGIRGRQMALDITPLASTPYTLLTYSDLSNADDFQIHIIGLSAFFTLCIIVLIILSAVINEWTGKKPGILLLPSRHFEWLRPIPRKKQYYRYLIRGMLRLIIAWLIMALILSLPPHKYEFALFYISVSLPFYAAFYYFTLREKRRRRDRTARQLAPLLHFLFLILILLFLFSCYDASSAPAIPIIFLLSQIVFFWIYLSSVCRYIVYHPSGLPNWFHSLQNFITPADRRIRNFCQLPRRIYWRLYNRLHKLRCLQLYSIAIITGVIVISIIPGCSIFWLLMRQESSIQRNSSRIEQARAIHNRRLDLNTAAMTYKFADTATPCSERTLASLKFDNGIYFLNDDRIYYPSGAFSGHSLPFTTQYSNIHRMFFSSDTNILASAIPPDSATDGTWKFFAVNPTDSDRNGTSHILLQYASSGDHRNPGPFRLAAGDEAKWSAIRLIYNTTRSAGLIFFLLFFGGQLLALFLVYKLTMAMATRIFLVDMFSDGLHSRHQLAGPVAGQLSISTASPFSDIRENEKALRENIPSDAEQILQNRLNFEKRFDETWKTLTPQKKFILYDLSRDGFSNYRTGNIIYGLLRDGLLVFRENGQLNFITRSFREYVLEKAEDPDVVALWRKSRNKGEWLSFKMPLMILFTAFGLFLFFTQDALFQKLTGLLTCLVSMTAQFSTLFDRTSAPGSSSQKESPAPEDKN